MSTELAQHYEGIAYEDDIAEGSEDLFPEDYERHFCHEDGEDWPCATVLAAALRLAADEAAGVIAAGDIAEVAAPVEGESGRGSAVANRDELYEDPAGWLRSRADEIERAGVSYGTNG